MRRFAMAMLVGGGVAALGVPHAARAQEQASPTTTRPTLGRFWLTADASGALGWSSHHHYYKAWSYPDGAIGAGMRLAPHVALRADLRIVPMSTYEERYVVAYMAAPPGYPTAVTPEQLGTIRSASLGASWFHPAPDGSPRFIWSLSPGFYEVADVGSGSPRRRAFGMAAALEQTMARGDHVLVTLQLGATVLPNVNRDVVWYTPVGVALRFW